MAVYKDEAKGTWRVIYRYTDWTGKPKQTQKRGFKTKREAQSLGKAKFLMTMERKGYTVTKYQGIICYRGVAVREKGFEELGEDDETPFDTA